MEYTIEEFDIPVLGEHNHASNLLELENGDILCTWFSGTNEGQSDVKITLSRFIKERKSWIQTQYVTTDNTRSEQNPILFKSRDNVLWIVYTSQEGIHQNSSIIRYVKSHDEGHNWSESKVLFNKPGSFVRNPPTVEEDGTIFFPAYYSIKSENGLFGEDYSVVKVSKDNGETWKEIKIPESNGLVHMSLNKVNNKKWIGFFRSRYADYIYRTESDDYGYTWSTPKPTQLMNNNASIQSKIFTDNSLMILFNNVNAKLKPPEKNMPPWFKEEDLIDAGVNLDKDTDIIWGTVRNPLTLAKSTDNGDTFEVLFNIQESLIKSEDDEYSYPSLLEDKDGDIHITYTFQRKFIKHKILIKG